MAHQLIEHRMTYDFLYRGNLNSVFNPSLIRSNDNIKKLALKKEDIPVVYLLHFIFQNDRIVIEPNSEKEERLRLPNEILYLLKEFLFEDYYKMIHKTMLMNTHSDMNYSLHYSPVYTESNLPSSNLTSEVSYYIQRDNGYSGFTVCPQCGNIINIFNRDDDVSIQITNQADHKYCVRRDNRHICDDLNDRPEYIYGSNHSITEDEEYGEYDEYSDDGDHDDCDYDDYDYDDHYDYDYNGEDGEYYDYNGEDGEYYDDYGFKYWHDDGW